MRAPSDLGQLGSTVSSSSRKGHALDLFAGLPRRYDLLSAVLSFGQDPRWRTALVDSIAPQAGEVVLDVATGTGLVAAELLGRSECSVVGIDQSPQMLAAAGARFSVSQDADAPARRPGRPARARIELIEGQAEALPFPDGSFDALTFTYLLRYVDDPRATMVELARVVRPGGRVASLEFGVPPWAPARAAWDLYTAVGLPLLGRLVSREWGAVGAFLGPSIRDFYARHPLERIVEYWRGAGLADVVVGRMSLGGGILMSANKAGDSRRDASPGVDRGPRPDGRRDGSDSSSGGPGDAGLA